MSTEHDATADEIAEDAPDDSRRELARKVLAGAGAMAAFGLLAEALGPSEAEASEPLLRRVPGARGTPGARNIENAGLKIRSIENGFSLKIQSAELAQHLAQEGVIERRYHNGVASIVIELTLSPPTS